MLAQMYEGTKERTNVQTDGLTKERTNEQSNTF